MAAPNSFDYFAIRNTIATYCIALDTKNFGLFEQVFTQDVETIYPFRGASRGLKDIAEAIAKRLTPITSQHALTTQIIKIAADGKTATAETYFTGIHFGKGQWEGKEVTAWGKYVDNLILIDGEPSLPGASGQWRINRRETVFMGRLGEERVMDEVHVSALSL